VRSKYDTDEKKTYRWVGLVGQVKWK